MSQDRSVYRAEIAKGPIELQIAEKVVFKGMLKAAYGTPQAEGYSTMEEVFKVNTPAIVMVHRKSKDAVVQSEVEFVTTDRKYLFVWYLDAQPGTEGTWVSLDDLNNEKVNLHGVKISDFNPAEDRKGCAGALLDQFFRIAKAVRSVFPGSRK